MTRNLKRLFFIVCSACTLWLAAMGEHPWILYFLTATCLLDAVLSAAWEMRIGFAVDYHLPWQFDVLFAGAMLTVFLMSGWWWCAGAWALILIGVCDSNSREEEA